MRTLAIGDVHGCLNALERLVECISLNSDDQLVFLGDYVDRGVDSKGVIDWLIQLQAHDKILSLRGNHDVMMMASRTDPTMFSNWLGYGGAETLESYGIACSEDWVSKVPEDHWQFLENTRLSYETSSRLFTHGGLNPDQPLAEQSEDVLCWMKLDQVKPHFSGKPLICGHTAQKSGEVFQGEGVICIDTWSVGKWLTCLDVDSGEYWQASELAVETRTGRIEF